MDSPNFETVCVLNVQEVKIIVHFMFEPQQEFKQLFEDTGHGRVCRK